MIAPPLLSWLSVPSTFKKPEKPFLNRVAKFLIHLALKKRKQVLIGYFSFFIISAISATFLVVDSNYLMFFRDNAPVRKLVDDINHNLSGANAFFVIVDTQQLNGLKQSHNLQAIAKLTDYLETRYETVISYDRFIRKTHKEMNNGQEKFFSVPDNDALISQYTLLMQPDTLERFADFEFQKACIVVRSNIVGSAKLNQDIIEIQKFVEHSFPARMKVNITGGSVLVAQASDKISREIIFNLALMLGGDFSGYLCLICFIQSRIISTDSPTVCLYWACLASWVY